MKTLFGQKHLIQCRCVLPQFKNVRPLQFHKFVVFSVIDGDAIRVKIAQCNNCGILHRITDLCRSEIVNGKETSAVLVTKEDLRPSMPEKLVAVLDANDADIASWEAAQFIIEHKRWGDTVSLSTEVVDGVKHRKYIRLISDTLFRIETASMEE